MAEKRRRKQFRTIYRTLVTFYVLAGIFLLPVTGFCVETDTQEIVEKAAQKVLSKEELKVSRPNKERGATKVYFMMFLLDIDSIDAAKQNFGANIFVRLRWKDGRLANPQGSTRQIPLEEVWNPQIILANREGRISKSLPEDVKVYPDGTVSYQQRYTGKLSQPLKLAKFPLDQHTFTIRFISAGYRDDELEFLPDTAKYDRALIGGSMAQEVSLPDWELLGYETLALPYKPIREIRQAGFVFRFEAKRYANYFFLQILLPMVLVVVMSWAAFWLQGDLVGVRIGISTSAILTLIAHRFVLANRLPRLPYMTSIDYVTVGSTFLVFLSLLGVVVTSYLTAINRNQTAKRIDLWARGVFPVTFLLLLGWFAFR